MADNKVCEMSAGRAKSGWQGDLQAEIEREWLITDGRGGYASGTAAGVPTRRYHGLLIAPARPPLERWLTVANVLERVGIGGRTRELASFEFDQAIHPAGHDFLTGFAVSNDPADSWVRFDYQVEDLYLAKQITLGPNDSEVCVSYRLAGPGEYDLSFELCPFVAMRDFHSLTRAFDPGYDVVPQGKWVRVDGGGGPTLWMGLEAAGRNKVRFEDNRDWWYGFRYQEEARRGQDHHEDLFVPGWFKTRGSSPLEVTFRTVADFTHKSSFERVRRAAISVPESIDLPEKSVKDSLEAAASAFVVTRSCADGRQLATILAGYHWFGDWGRDTFIALPGLLIETGRYAEARQVLEVFASAQQDGLMPNRFSDYGDGRDYNSVDASLWFVHAADTYVRATGDDKTWTEVLAPACHRMVEAFTQGTLFNIAVDSTDSLLACGDESTQLTWMDAKCGDVVFTPRHGKPVEINALWYHALCILAEREVATDPAAGKRLAAQAERTAVSFNETFWNDRVGGLYDVVRGNWADPAVRPNQIFAVSLPHSPLEESRQEAVVNLVRNRLLTSFGLRSLCQRHPSYAGRYEGDAFARDSVYHQGTVWAWLIGPFIEAWLRVNDHSEAAKAQGREWLMPLVDHLEEAGLGSVSEIFDGEPPHRPGGTIAQAWSVSELLRAWNLTEPA